MAVALGGLVARRLSVECWWEEGGNLGNRSPAQANEMSFLSLGFSASPGTPESRRCLVKR